MRRKILWLLGLVGLCLTAPSQMRGNATTVTFTGAGISCLNATSLAACTGPQFNIWNTGDFISETFSGTGLASVDQLSLSLSLFDNLASGQQESWSIELNGTQIGTLSETGTGGSTTIPYTTTLNFVSLAGPNYSIGFFVLTPGVPVGNGTLGIQTGLLGTSTATLSGGVTPEPA